MNKFQTLEELCAEVKNDILLADTMWFPNSYPLTPNQIITLHSYFDRRFIFHQAPRSGAKSWITARFILLYALLNEITAILTAPTYRQALLVFNNILRFIKENSTPNNPLPISREIDGRIIGGGSMEARVKFKNGSVIKALPMGCLTPDTLVMTSVGFEEMGAMTKEYPIYGSSRFRKINQIFQNPLSKTLRITTKRGYTIEGTPEHRIKDSTGNWRTLSSFAIGQTLPIDTTSIWHNGEEDFTVDEAYAAGLMVGDGHWTNKYYLGFCSIDSELVQHLSVLGTPKTYDGKHYQILGKANREKFLTKFGIIGLYGESKQFPAKVLKSSRSQTAAFISGLFDTDGHVQYTPNQPKGRTTLQVSFYNTSKVLVRQLQTILLRYGIVSTLKLKTTRKKLSVLGGREIGAVHGLKPCYFLTISGNDVIRFEKEIGFRLARKAETLRQGISVKLRFQKERVDNLFHDSIVDISQSESETVDLNIPDQNLYCANGFISHNSGDKIRGERADILHCDEFFNMDATMFRIHILPFLQKPTVKSNNPNVVQKPPGKLIMTTSAEYEDCFAYHYLVNQMLPKIREENEIVERDPTYKRKYCVIDWNVEDLSRSGYELDKDILELQTAGADSEERQRVLYNRWVGVSGQFFPNNMQEKLESPLVQVEEKAQEGFSYALTVDVATVKGGDDFVIDVWKFLGNRKMALVNSYWDNGLSNSDMAHKIHQFNDAFHPELIYMDKGGGGLFVMSALSQRKLVLSSGEEIIIPDPILPYDEISMMGQKILLMNRPTDPKVQGAFAGERARGGQMISSEDILSHLMYDGLRKNLLNSDPIILIPLVADDHQDQYARSEVNILDNIRESVHQLRHLTILTKEVADGKREIVLSKINRVPTYMWKHARKDGAMTFCYGYVPYLLHYAEDRGADRGEPGVIAEPQIMTDEYYNISGSWDDPSMRIFPSI